MNETVKSDWGQGTNGIKQNQKFLLFCSLHFFCCTLFCGFQKKIKDNYTKYMLNMNSGIYSNTSFYSRSCQILTSI